MLARLTLVLISFIAVLGDAGPVRAQSVDVRSGEHDGFTRLVLYLPAGVEAEVSRTETGSRVQTNRRVGYDISKIFQRIDRDRFTDVLISDDGGDLMLEYDCDCQLRRELLVGNVLVLDLVGKPGSKPTDGVAEGTAPSVADNPTPVTLPVTPNLPSRPSLADARRISDAATMILPQPESESEKSKIKRLSDLEQAMIDQVARTATQGLLDIADGGVGRPNQEDSEPKEARPQQNLEPTPVEEMKFGGARTRTSTLAATPNDKPVTADGRHCLPDESIAIGTWNSGEGFNAELGPRRAALYGEFDEPIPEAVIELSKFYLSFGFGAEAANTLEMLDEARAETPILNSIARIVNFGHDPQLSPFDDQLDCDSDVAFWAALASKPFPPDATIETAAILRTLNTLPPHLRQMLGPELADRFLAAERADMSEAILRVLTRTSDLSSTEQTLVTGKLDLDRGNLDQGRENLSNVVSEASEDSPEALILLVKDLLQRDEAVDPSLAELLGAHFLQYRDSPMIAELASAEILARAGAGQFAVAFDLLDQRLAEEVPLGDVEDVRNMLVRMLLRSAQDDEILQQGFKLSANDSSTLPKDITIELAGKFLEFGFPDRAFDLLEDIPATGDASTALLKAEAALKAGRPQRAEAELIGIDGPEADGIRAQAQAAAGDYEAASETYAGMDQSPLAEENAWRAGQWDQLSESEDQVNAALATIMQSSDPTDDPSMGMIARSQRLLQNTRASRQTIEDMLQRYSAPTTE